MPATKTRKKGGSKKPKVMGQSAVRGYRSKASISADKQRKAKTPGRRRSKSGNMYTERRVNRSDINRKKGL